MASTAMRAITEGTFVMRRRAFIGAAIAVVAGLSALVPTAANAVSCTGGLGGACAGSTNVTFALTGGSLNLTVPASVDFSSSPFTPTGVANLTYTPTWPSGSPIQVNDLRLASLGWVDTVSPLTAWSGPNSSTMPTGLSTFSVNGGCGTQTGLTTLTTPAVTLTSGGVLMTAVAPGDNAVSCVPTLTIAVPPTAQAGTYTGTITQTVV